MRFTRILLSCMLLFIACAHLKQARQSYQNRDYQKAIALCRTAIARDSSDTDAWLLLSRIYLDTDSADQSLIILSDQRQYYDLSPKQKSQMVDQYLIHSEKAESPEQSISLLMRAEQADSMHVDLLDTLAALFEGQKKYEQAKIRYNRLIYAAEDPLPYMSRVNAIENRQAFAASEFEKGMAALKSGNKQKAEKHLQKAALTNPGFSRAVYKYGMLAGKRLYRIGSQEALDEAIPALRNAVEAKPRDIEARYLLARACERKGQSCLGEAIRHYQILGTLARKGKYNRISQRKINLLKKRKAFWENGK